MQKNFPTRKIVKRKPSISLVATFKRINEFFKSVKSLKEHRYKIKIEFLKDECYKVYLKRILEQRRLLKVIDLPEFFYTNGWVIDSEAKKLSEMAILKVEEKFGKRHIEKCYNARIKAIIKELKKK